MNYESPFIRHGITFLGLFVAGFFTFAILVRPFKEAAPRSMREQTASEIAAMKRVVPPVAIPEPEGIDAEAYVIRLVGEETPLLRRREIKPMPPASLTKLMTAVVVHEELSPSDVVTFSRSAKSMGAAESDARSGETFMRDDMLKFALIGSANDAAQAVAETVAKKYHAYDATAAQSVFAGLMNKKATELGMSNSHFQNPIGLDDPDHSMSAADVARLLEYIFEKHRAILAISRAVETTVYSVDHHSHTITNTNDLLKEYPAILGSKTGFTDAAQGALAMLYPVRPNHTGLIVLMGSHNRFGDGRKLIRWLENSFPGE